MLSIIDQYQRSPLAAFHDSFYREFPHPPEQWEATYDRTPLHQLPACVGWPLQQPNDRLLRPAVIQHITRALMAQGWRPRHIAGLIHSRYARDFGWGDRWYHYDAACRADFYVRIFAGSIVAGYDALIDFNCVSTREKHYCPLEHCHNNLQCWKEQLLARMHHE
jgi:hypothetical protein